MNRTLTASVVVDGETLTGSTSVDVQPRVATGEKFVAYGSSRFSPPDLTESNAQKHQRYAAPYRSGVVGPALDGPPVYRKFFSGSLKTWSADNDLRHIAANERTLTRPIVSMKDWAEADVRAHIASIPSHVTEMLVWFHEPNDNFIGASARAGFRERYIQLRDLLRSINSPRVILGMILVGWHVAEWRDFYIPGLGAFGFDRYNPTRSGQYKSMRELMDPLWDAYLQTDADRFVIGETGCDVLNGNTLSAVAWAQDVIDWMDAHAPLTHGPQRDGIWCSWWDAIGHGTSPIINDTQLKNQMATAAVWRQACAQSRLQIAG